MAGYFLENPGTQKSCLVLARHFEIWADLRDPEGAYEKITLGPKALLKQEMKVNSLPSNELQSAWKSGILFIIIYLSWFRQKCHRADEQKNEWASMCEG